MCVSLWPNRMIVLPSAARSGWRRRYRRGPLRANADDRLSLDPLGRIERRNGIVEGRDVADNRPQTSVPHPLDNLTKLRAIGHDNEVDRQAVGRPCLRRPCDGHECSAGSDQTRGPRSDVAADDIEYQIDPADVVQ